LFHYYQVVIDVNAEIPDRALDIRVSKQQLNGSQIAGPSVDQRRLRPASAIVILLGWWKMTMHQAKAVELRSVFGPVTDGIWLAGRAVRAVIDSSR
jgi:hypothetical protein